MKLSQTEKDMLLHAHKGVTNKLLDEDPEYCAELSLEMQNRKASEDFKQAVAGRIFKW